MDTITDINEVYPVTIVARDHYRKDKLDNYYAFNLFQNEIPSQNTWVKFEGINGELKFISSFDYWLETKHVIYGKGNCIKDACKDLVCQINKNIDNFNNV